MEIAQWILAPLAVLASLVGSLYVLHRLVCHLARQGLMHGLDGSRGGSGYNPLQEMIQPQIRHVTQAQEQRTRENEDEVPGEPAAKSVRHAPGDGPN